MTDLSERLFLGLLALLAWAPLPLGSNRPWACAILELWASVLGGAYLWGYSRGLLRTSIVFGKARPVLLLLVCWLLYSALQLLPMPVALVSAISPEAARIHALANQVGWISLTVDFHATLSSLLLSATYVIVFCLTLLLADGEERIRLLAQVLVFSGLFQAFYGAFMTLSGLEYGFFVKKIAYISNATGTFVNRNHLAGYLEMCLSVGIGLMISSLGGKAAFTWKQRMRNIVSLLLGKKLRLRLYLAVMVIALVLTHSRMGNSAFFSSMIAAGIVGLLLSKHATRSTVILLASLVVIDTFIVGTWFGVEKVVSRIENTSMIHDAGRIYADRNSLNIVRDYFLTGSGGGSFYAVFPAYRTADIENFFDHAHDDYLEFASGYGVSGMSLLGGIVLSSLAAALVAQYRRRNPLMRGMAFSSTMAIVALMIHSFVDFNLQIPANAMTFMTMLALAWISLHGRLEST